MGERICEKCGVLVPVQNFELHEVRCRVRSPLPSAPGMETSQETSGNEHYRIPQPSAPASAALGGYSSAASDSWSCDSCTLENDASAAVCAACDRPRSGLGRAADATATTASASRASRVWACEHCTFENDGLHDTCTMCGAESRRAQQRRQDSWRLQTPEEVQEPSDDFASSANTHWASVAMGTLAGGALGLMAGNNRHGPRSAASSTALGAATGAALGSMMAPLFQEVAQPRQRRSASTGVQRGPRSARPTPQGNSNISHDDFFSLLQGDMLAPGILPDELSLNRFSQGRRVVVVQPGGIEMLMQQMAEQMSEEQGPSLQPAQAGCISSLPTHVLTATEAQNLPQESRSCPICMEDFKEGDEQMTLPCFHKFHKGCSDEWLNRQGTCPICKHRVDGQ